MTRVFRSFPLTTALLLWASVFAGCATQQGTYGTNGPVIVAPPEALPPLTQPPPVNNPPLVIRPQPPPPGGYPKTLKDSGAGPAVLSLARQAQESRAAGKLDSAVGQLERALRIEPRNAFVWQMLADAHLQLQHAEQAENAAQKSNSLARGNPYLVAGNWRLIAASRSARGDAAGARQASSRVDELSSALSPTP